MPEVWTVIPLEAIQGSTAPQVTRDSGTQRISQITIASPLVEATAVMQRAVGTQQLEAVLWQLEDP
jgi:hypothetical protein